MTTSLLIATGYLAALVLGGWGLNALLEWRQKRQSRLPPASGHDARRFRGHQVLAPGDLAERTDVIVPGRGAGKYRLPEGIRRAEVK